MNFCKDLTARKREAKKIAKDLQYPKEVLLAINVAESDFKITQILASARKGEFKLCSTM